MPHSAYKIELKAAVLGVLHPEPHRPYYQKRNQWKNRQHDEKGNNGFHRLKIGIKPE